MRVFFGDLNFRIALAREQVVQHIKDKNYAALMQHDELYKFGLNDKLLQTMQEGTLTFDPTYKLKFGTSTYEESRVPSWTDRVLFAQKTESIKLLQYMSAKEISISDHKPVLAHFGVKVRKVDEEAKALLEQSLIQKFMVMKQNETALNPVLQPGLARHN